jgi:5-methylcytosine-specific restriction endonuclease McrA
MPRKKNAIDDIIWGKGVNSPFQISQKPKRDSRRAFTRTQKNEILYQQDGKCAKCHKKLDPRAIEFDHKKPWASGGRTITQNGRALCPECHKIVTHAKRLRNTNKKRKPKDPLSLF